MTKRTLSKESGRGFLEGRQPEVTRAGRGGSPHLTKGDVTLELAHLEGASGPVLLEALLD